MSPMMFGDEAQRSVPILSSRTNKWTDAEVSRAMSLLSSGSGPVRPFPWPGPAGIRKFWFSDSGFGFEAWTQAATQAPLICCEPASIPLGIPCLGMERMATGCNDTLAPPPPQPRLSAIFPPPRLPSSLCPFCISFSFRTHPIRAGQAAPGSRQCPVSRGPGRLGRLRGQRLRIGLLLHRRPQGRVR